jgi:hypothetical protein
MNYKYERQDAIRVLNPSEMKKIRNKKQSQITRNMFQKGLLKALDTYVGKSKKRSPKLS